MSSSDQAPDPSTPAKSGESDASRRSTVAVASTGATERQKLTGRAVIVALGTLSSRILGLLRDVVLVAIFSTYATDAFKQAFTIPNVLRQLLAEGAVQTGVIPVLSETREKRGEDDAQEFFQAIRGLSLTLLTIVSVLGVIAAPWLVELFAAGFHETPGKFELTVQLTRWMFPYIFFMGTAALGLAALNTHGRFTVAAFAPALLNVAFIASALLLPQWFTSLGKPAIYAMALGALVGGALQVIAQWPSLKKIGYLRRPRLAFSHPGVREVLRRMVPVLFGVGVYYIDMVLARRFLSEVGSGAVTYFDLAFRLADFPQGVFVMALQTAALPSLSLLFSRGEHVELGRTFAFGMRLALFVGIAATVACVALAEPLVRLMYQRGEFETADATQTAYALMALGLGVWSVSAVRQLVAVYYAMGDTRTPVLVSALDLIVFVSLALWLREPLGHVGIALAVSGSTSVQMVALWLLLKRRLADLHTMEVIGSALKAFAAAAIAGGSSYAIIQALEPKSDASSWAHVLPGVASGIAYVVIFIAAARLLRSPEVVTVLSMLARRLRFR